MNRTLDVYADVDSFFDYRRGLLQYLMTEKDFPEGYNPKTEQEAFERMEDRKSQGDKLWALHVERNYQERRFDTFNYPQFDINEEKFKAIYKERSLKHWATGMFYPTRLIKQLVTRIIDIESLTDKPIDIKEVRLYVNTFPYVLDEALTAELVESIRYGLKGLVAVKAIYSDPATHTAQFYGQYNYVFRYNMMHDESSEAFSESFKEHPIPETAFVLPDVLVRDNDTFAGEVKDWMIASFLWLGPALKLLPIEHSLYDYDDGNPTNKKAS